MAYRRAQEISLESLNDGPGILPFKLGSTKIISHYHSFLQIIELDVIHSNIELVKKQINDFRPQLKNATFSLFEPHIEHLSRKISQLLELLGTFETKRVKRGLIDGLGSIIKSISGNLDYTDALRYDNAIKIIQSNQNKITEEFNTHLTVGKNLMSEHTRLIEELVLNQKKIEDTVNLIVDNMSDREMRYAHLAQYLFILSDNIENLSDEILRLENVIASISSSSTHHSVLNLSSLISMLNKIKIIYDKREILDISLRDYYELIRVGSYYNSNQLVIIFKVPVVYPDTYTLYKLSIVPNKFQKALIPPYPYIAISRKESLYIEAECPKSNQLYICLTTPVNQFKSESDCMYQIIEYQKKDDSCTVATVHLPKGAMEQLDEKHYTLSFPETTKVEIICGLNHHTTLRGSYLATLPLGCSIRSAEFTISNSNDQVKGKAVIIMDPPCQNYTSNSQEPSIQLNSINLENLHSSNMKVSLLSPIRIDEVPSDKSLYHTTIPMYAVFILCGSILCLIGTYKCRNRHIRMQRARSQKNPTEKAIKASREEDIELTSVTNPDHTDEDRRSAIFTTKVF